MNKIRFKQRKLFKAVKILTVIAAIFIFVYIGIQPYVKNYSAELAVVLNYVCDILVVAVLAVLFLYVSKYGKCDSFLSSVENEINDAGYYFTSRTERDSESLINVIYEDLKSCGYSVNKNQTINDFDFSVKASKKNEFFYIADIDGADKNDVVAYLDAVINDLTVNNLKRKGNAVLCIVTDKADESAVGLSKMITPVGRKEQLKIALAICESESERVYFLGNVQTKCQQMIVNFAMNCELPIKEQYISKEKLPFQYELEKRMEGFTIKDYKNGNFYAH